MLQALWDYPQMPVMKTGWRAKDCRCKQMWPMAGEA